VIDTDKQKFFATCARGLEPILAEEWRRLGAADVTPGRGGVHAIGDRVLLYQSNLWLRCAIRVLCPILEATVTTPEELYDAVRQVDWSRYMTPDHTLAVDCNVRDSRITHSKYAALKTKDAICDQFVERVGKRPSVDTNTPMVGLNLHIYCDQAVLSLDSSGESLHKRGYRPIQTKAPLNEALAAGLVFLSGWQPDTPLIDPMCGSGTLCIEAAWMALHRPPGLTRHRFGFMGWMDYDVALWTELRDTARRNVGRSLAAAIVGSDVRRDAVNFANSNARAAGIGHLLHFDVKDIRDLQPPADWKGTIICNPPYGERLGEEKELRGLYQMLGRVLRERCQGWRAFVFTGNARLARSLDLSPVSRTPLFNGKIPCQLLGFQL
jgi:putative N6-adenine-specific DNA methylase